MAQSPFAFFRGSCVRFYAALPQTALLRSAPRAWACGDLHIANFGTYKADNRLVYFDINDFDEGTLAPCTYDALRLVCSLMVASKTLKLSLSAARVLARTMLERYAAALAAGHVRWVERDNANGPIATLLRKLKARSRRKFWARRVSGRKGEERLIVDGVKTLAATADEIEHVRSALESHRASNELIRASGTSPSSPLSASSRSGESRKPGRSGKSSKPLPPGDSPAHLRVLDVARRIAGNGSLGRARFVALVRGHGETRGGYLLDLKLAAPSALQSTAGAANAPWPNEAARVVAIERTMLAAPPAFLESLPIGSESYVVRELQPSDDRLDLEALSDDPAELGRTLATLAEILAWDQLRAAARGGSATVADFISFAKDLRWQQGLLSIAEDSARRNSDDWSAFRHAFARQPVTMAA